MDKESLTVEIFIDGHSFNVLPGISVASAVLGYTNTTHTTVNNVDKSFRSPFCLMGVCFECLMEIDGKPDVQSCLVTVRDGMRIRRQLNFYR